jgi:uncharacterized protein (TIGR03437 family)
MVTKTNGRAFSCGQDKRAHVILSRGGSRLGVLFRSASLAATIFLCSFAGKIALAQTPAFSVLEIDINNFTGYTTDTFDPSKFATDPNRTMAAAVRNFAFVIAVGDITMVNGKPARGSLIVAQRSVSLSPSPTAGQARADVTRTAVTENLFEIQQSDGTYVGSIYGLGLAGGPGPLGTPAGSTANVTIAGGTGAFLGARGQMVATFFPGVVAFRAGSITENPERRRDNAAGEHFRFVLQVIPMTRPEIAQTAAGPAIVHSASFLPVSASNAAKPSETLSLWATGLGPTVPFVNPGERFPANPLSVVNSPVEVTVNGEPAELIGAVGYPGSTDGYQVNFRVPGGTPSGMATVQLSVAWIKGAAVQIPVQ